MATFRWIGVLAAVAGGIALNACGGSGGGGSDDPTPAATVAPPTETRAAEPTVAEGTPAVTASATQASDPTAAAATATAPENPTATSTTEPTNTPPPTATPWPALDVLIEGRPSVWSIDSVTAGIGTKVTWKWADSLHVHNLAVDGYFQADNPTKQGTRTVTFETKGTFYFTCAAHPDTMWGVVEIR